MSNNQKLWEYVSPNKSRNHVAGVLEDKVIVFSEIVTKNLVA